MNSMALTRDQMARDVIDCGDCSDGTPQVPN